MSTTPVETTPAADEPKLVAVFKSRLPSVNYIFKNGKPAIFINGRFLTSVKAEIEELVGEVELGHPHIYVDKEEVTAPATEVFSMEVLREKIIAEHMATMAAATNPDQDLGKTEQGPLVPASSTDVAQAAAGGSGASSVAKLANFPGLTAPTLAKK